MNDHIEVRLLVGDLIARCMDIGLTKAEIMTIVTGQAGDVSTLLGEAQGSGVIETRVRHLHEVVRIARDICGAETEPWLRTENQALGKRSPLGTLIEFPNALAGMMHLMRRLGEDGGTIH